MSINYVNENIGKKCGSCGKGIIYFIHQKVGNKELEMIACTNEACKGHIQPENIL